MFTIENLNKATADFQKYVEPQLYDSGLFDPCNSYVIVCEGDKDDLKSKMDIFAGIDMCTIDKEKQVVQGIASRIQRGACYRTFTIRALTDNGSFGTELKKRYMAIKNGDMYPTWTIQAYINPDPADPDKLLCTVGIVRTIDLFNYALPFLENANFQSAEDFINTLLNCGSIGELRVRQNYAGGAIFLCCNWDYMRQKGIEVTILKGAFNG